MLKDFLTLLINCEENSVLMFLKILQLLMYQLEPGFFFEDLVQEIGLQYLDILVSQNRINAEFKSYLIEYLAEKRGFYGMTLQLREASAQGYGDSLNNILFYFIRCTIIHVQSDVNFFAKYGHDFRNLLDSDFPELFENATMTLDSFKPEARYVDLQSEAGSSGSSSPIPSDSSSSSSSSSSSLTSSSSSSSLTSQEESAFSKHFNRLGWLLIAYAVLRIIFPS